MVPFTFAPSKLVTVSKQIIDCILTQHDASGTNDNVLTSYISNVTNKRLIHGTTSRRRAFIGYLTKVGNLAVGYDLIASLHTGFVCKLAYHVDISDDILAQSPTAVSLNTHIHDAELAMTHDKIFAPYVEDWFTPPSVNKCSKGVACLP